MKSKLANFKKFLIVDYLYAISKILFSKKQSRTYYSQFGEDAVLRELISKKDQKGTYLDIGCYHPRKHSNTYLLYKMGWSGMLVDVEKTKLIACKIIRPRDETLLCAVSNEKGFAPIFAPKKYSVLTSLVKINDEFKKIGTIEQKTISEIIENNLSGNCPTVLSIDVELKDYDAIKSIDFKRHSPKFILIECSDDDFNIDQVLQTKIHRLLIKNKYNLISWTLNTGIYKINKSN
tara:strand:- start:700 stop:1401 length:702 start_codon:yes stop_codon:yes gene_type:complete